MLGIPPSGTCPCCWSARATEFVFGIELAKRVRSQYYRHVCGLVFASLYFAAAGKSHKGNQAHGR